MFKIYDELESPNEGACFPESRNVRHRMNRNRQVTAWIGRQEIVVAVVVVVLVAAGVVCVFVWLFV